MSLPTIDMLNPEQKYALDRLVQFIQPSKSSGNPEAIRMSGPPGSGKTTTLVLSLLKSSGGNVLVTAPTNKATRQLRKMLDEAGVSFDTMTIYKALGMRLMDSGEVRYVSGASNNPPINEYDIVVVDEYSMISTKVMQELSNASVVYNLKLIYLGDDDQLPPVKESKSPVSEMVPDFLELTRIERSDAGSPVQDLVGAIRQQIRTGGSGQLTVTNVNDADKGGVYVLSDWMQHFKVQAKACWDSKNIDLSRAIAYTNDRVDFLNTQAREFIFGNKAPRFVVGEKLIVATPVVDPIDGAVLLTTDEEVEVLSVKESTKDDEVDLSGVYKVWELEVQSEAGFAPDTLTILHESESQRYAEQLAAIKKRCYADHREWPKTFYPFQEQFHDVRYPYAITAHRSQGSTYHSVFVDSTNISYWRGNVLSDQMYWRLLYVAVSRAKFNVALNTSTI